MVKTIPEIKHIKNHTIYDLILTHLAVSMIGMHKHYKSERGLIMVYEALQLCSVTETVVFHMTSITTEC